MRWLFVLVLAACGSVKATTPDSAVEPDSPIVDPDGRIPVWGPHVLVDVGHFSGGNPGNVRNPVVADDGLNIYFIDSGPVGGGDVFDAFTASRISTASDFGMSSLIPVVNVTNVQQRYLEISGDGLELYFSTGAIDAPIMVSTRANVGAPFTTPTAVGAGIDGNFPSISGNKLSLYFLKSTGAGVAGELKLATRTAIGQPWSAPTTVVVPGAVEIFSSIEISVDELAILRAPALTASTPAPIVINRRATKTAPFDQTEVLPSMDFTNCAFASARFANNDTEIWTGQKNNDKEGAFVSRLE